MASLREILTKASRPVVVIMSLALVAVLAILDYWNGPNLSLAIFYLVPVFYTTWFAGRQAGVLVSIFCAAAWSIDDMTGRGGAAFRIPYWNVLMQFFFLLFVVHVLHSLKSALSRERDLAREDYLTKVANARFFYEIASAEIARSRRYSHPLTLAYIDIDNFKSVNDRMGHSVGDHLLGDIAQTMKNNVRVVDMVARMGGDEFAVLMPETGQEGAKSVISRLRQGITDAAKKSGWPVTVSMGVVTCEDYACTLDNIIKKADELMYSVKSAGKNSFKSEVLKGPDNQITKCP